MTTVAIITDQHLDGRKGNINFWNYFKKFYDDVFFPTLEKKKIKTVLDLGDTFDQRKSIDFNVWNRIRTHYFKRLEDMGVEVHMIVGNHTAYYKNTNYVNSPNLLLGEFPNIKIYSEPTEITVHGRKICLLPWINSENKQKSLDLIKSTDAEIAMGHLELDGFEMTPGLVGHGMSPIVFANFKKVFTGHYHHKSKKGNITYLGNPYEMYWNDYNDPRGFHLFTPDTMKTTLVKNPYRMFKKLYYNDVDKDMEVDYNEYKDTYIKVIVEEKRDYEKFEMMIDHLYKAGAHDVKIVETLIDNIIDEDSSLEIKDTLTLLNEYIDEVEMTVDKDDLKKVMRSLYIESAEMV